MAGDLRVSMLFEANTAAARAAVKELQAATGDMRGTLEGVGAAANRTTAPVDAVAAGFAAAGEASGIWQRFVTELRRALNPLADEAAGVTEAMRQVTFAEEAGALSAHEAALAQDALARKALDLQARAAGMGLALDGSRRATEQQETALQKLIAANTGLAAATGRSVAAELQHGQMLDALRARFDPLFAAQRRYEQELGDIAEAERLGAISATTAAEARERASRAMGPLAGGIGAVGQASRNSSAYVANLSFQLNDIGMMMAMGQSPFMLMMQQGPQVTQVFAQMRAAGIGLGTALRDAFAMVVNPTALATLAVIGFGAAAVKWLTASGEEALSLEDAVSRLSNGVGKLQKALSDALVPVRELRQEWGAQAEQIAAIHSALADLARIQALADLGASARAARSEFAALFESLARVDYERANPGNWGSESGIAAYLDGIREKYGLIEADARRLQPLLQTLFAVPAGDAAGYADASAKVREAIMEIARTSPEAAEHLAGLAESLFQGELAARNLAGPMSEAGVAAKAQRTEAEATEAALARQYQWYSASRRAAAAAGADAEAELARLQQEAGLRALIVRYGADSVQVAEARHAAERAAYAAAVALRGVSQDMKDQLLAAWDAANGLAGGLGSAASRAGTLAAELRGASSALQALVSQTSGLGFDNIGRAAQLEALRAGRSVEEARVTGLVAQKRAELQPLLDQGAEVARYARQQLFEFEAGQRLKSSQEAELAQYNRTTAKGGGGGAAATDESRKALDELIASERQQIRLLQTTDPLQRAMIENHEALKAATEGERQAVENLIAERQRLEEVARATEEMRQSFEAAFRGIVTGSESVTDALSNILGKLADLAADAAFQMLWRGVLGDLVGSFVDWLIPGKAEGGRVSGPGGPREDNLLHWLSSGEFVVNAADAARNLPLLEAMNAGLPAMDLLRNIARAPRLADGGLVGAAPTLRSLSGSGRADTPGTAPQRIELRLHLDSELLRAEIVQTSAPVALQISERGIDRFSRHELPDRVARIGANPRLIG